MKIPRIGPPKNLRPAGIHVEPKRREHRESKAIDDGLDEFQELYHGPIELPPDPDDDEDMFDGYTERIYED